MLNKRKQNSHLGSVKFTKDTYRPYITPYDLVTSENFQKELERAMKKRGRVRSNEVDASDS